MRNGNRCVEFRERHVDRVLKRVKRLEMAAEDRSDDDVEHVLYGIDASFRKMKLRDARINGEKAGGRKGETNTSSPSLCTTDAILH
ncbi:hypothetical protein L1887_17044 [Cichorium endivia]|nr:hypothetical protein L1887_17044 [Cichorium endivia]